MIVLEIVFLTVFWAWVFAAALFLRNTILPRLPITASPEQFSLPFELVRFHSTDGIPLEGWKIPGQPGQPWLILCHGLGANRADLLEIAQQLHAATFNLLLFDFRAHGGSGGRVTSFGWREQRDLEGALAFLGQQPDIPAKRYGVYGLSMGAAVALMTAARDERLAAVVADSSYANLEDALGRHMTLLYPVPKIPLLWFVLATYRLRFGIWPRDVSARDGAARLSPQAVLLIHGSGDTRNPLTGTEQIFTAASEPKELWVIDGAQHLEGYGLDPQAYRDRLLRFFQTHLS